MTLHLWLPEPQMLVAQTIFENSLWPYLLLYTKFYTKL